MQRTEYATYKVNITHYFYYQGTITLYSGDVEKYIFVPLKSVLFGVTTVSLIFVYFFFLNRFIFIGKIFLCCPGLLIFLNSIIYWTKNDRKKFPKQIFHNSDGYFLGLICLCMQKIWSIKIFVLFSLWTIYTIYTMLVN